MKCPHCDKVIPARMVKSEAAKLSSAMRKKHGAGSGRPRSERCRCGAMTLAMAKRKNHRCGGRR